MLIAVIVAVAAAVVCLLAAGGWHAEVRDQERLIADLRADLSRRPLPPMSFDAHADQALALTAEVPGHRQWVVPSADQLARWASRPGYRWEVNS